MNYSTVGGRSIELGPSLKIPSTLLRGIKPTV